MYTIFTTCTINLWKTNYLFTNTNIDKMKSKCWKSMYVNYNTEVCNPGRNVLK